MNFIASALAAGAGAALNAGASAAAKDLYGKLVDAVKERFGSGSDQKEISDALDMLERKPESAGRQEVVAELLTDSGAADDSELVRLATALLGTLQGDHDPHSVHQTASGHNVIQQVGDGSGAIVDRSKRKMTGGDHPTPPTEPHTDLPKRAASGHVKPPPIEQRATGHNVIQQVGSGVAQIFDIDVNVSRLGALVVALPILLLAAVVTFVATRTDGPSPITGNGLKVAVAALAGDGGSGSIVASHVASTLMEGLDADEFTVAGPAIVTESPDDPADAGRLAEVLEADVVIYGTATPTGRADESVYMELRMVVASQGTAESSPLVFEGVVGSRLIVVPEDLSSSGIGTTTTLQNLVRIVRGVGGLSADNFELAREQLKLAAEAATSSDDKEFRSVVESLRGFTELRDASVQRDPALIDAAVERFNEGLRLDPASALAESGILSASYLRNLHPETLDVIDNDAMREVVDELDALAGRATNDSFAKVTAATQAAQGRISLGTSADLERARNDLEALLDSLPDLDQRAWGMFESFIEEKLGLIAFIQDDSDGAIAHYNAAVEGATPFWSAFYLAAVGRIMADSGAPCDAVTYLVDAAAVAGDRFPVRAAEYTSQAEVAEADCE